MYPLLEIYDKYGNLDYYSLLFYSFSCIIEFIYSFLL